MKKAYWLFNRINEKLPESHKLELAPNESGVDIVLSDIPDEVLVSGETTFHAIYFLLCILKENSSKSFIP